MYSKEAVLFWSEFYLYLFEYVFPSEEKIFQYGLQIDVFGILDFAIFFYGFHSF